MRRDKEKPSSSDSSGLEDDVEDEDAYEFAPVHATRRDKEKPSSSDTAPKHVTTIIIDRSREYIEYNILLFINLASTKDTLIKSYSCAHFRGFHLLLPCMLSSSHCMRCQVLISCLTIDYRN